MVEINLTTEGNMRRIALIGYGAIGRRAARMIADDGSARIAAVLLRPGSPARALVEADGFHPVETLEALLAHEPALVAEAAGHTALTAHGPDLLAAGVELLAASAGALADTALRTRLLDAARRGDAPLTVPAGAIGGLDALTAMHLAGLDRVTYTGRKPPEAWRGSPAEDLLDLAALDQEAVFFEGDAGTAARTYPKNANVAATLALAGLGFDDTLVRLVADPAVQRNVHEIEAEGTTGSLALRLEGLPDPENPRTSALTAASVAAVALGRVGGLRLTP
jgi:aspartate dehydrogenase